MARTEAGEVYDLANIEEAKRQANRAEIAVALLALLTVVFMALAFMSPGLGLLYGASLVTGAKVGIALNFAGIASLFLLSIAAYNARAKQKRVGFLEMDDLADHLNSNNFRNA